ncbi:hypothetical protein ZIOFF_046318 [Zingiber officinale]|uniref:Uncharacterized protein n=1 Tax=Zingiber officinale TaxID=94328 RepID=A0A8J5G0V3_ZINOF|nr:hypothetical protein ZIOFF_046318 [Zingiber officinale]
MFAIEFIEDENELVDGYMVVKVASWNRRTGLVCNATISYKHRCPALSDNLLGVDPCQIPTSENEAANWLVEIQADGSTLI